MCYLQDYLVKWKEEKSKNKCNYRFLRTGKPQYLKHCTQQQSIKSLILDWILGNPTHSSGFLYNSIKNDSDCNMSVIYLYSYIHRPRPAEWYCKTESKNQRGKAKIKHPYLEKNTNITSIHCINKQMDYGIALMHFPCSPILCKTTLLLILLCNTKHSQLSKDIYFVKSTVHHTCWLVCYYII